MTLVVPGREKAKGASLHGNRPIYPASVVKLFYMVAAQAWLEAGKLRPTAELRSALAAIWTAIWPDARSCSCPGMGADIAYCPANSIIAPTSGP